MKSKIYLFLAQSLVLSFFGCSDDKDAVSLPIVQTLNITDITSSSASSGGIITNDGRALVIEKGICYGLESNPTIENSTKTSDGKDLGEFASALSNLTPNTEYFVRAYATNGLGTSYGNEISFITTTNSIVYKTDGRIVKYGDPLPIALDITEDGLVDFTIFVELHANYLGDHLNVGMNPIGFGRNLIKSGPQINENFKNMGFLVAETLHEEIDSNLLENQYWTEEFAALVIRHTKTNGEIYYEGNWADSSQIVAIQTNINGAFHFGWIRVEFDKTTELVTLIDYAYNSIANQSIKVGETSN
ncbi:hypothetical protein V8G69_07300 [Gaetbulibacter sp. M235]|uniref:hypothetical protein n=1 Tax=Gaetbulibacter sp. M235 TaxID=3126510 RepID=UPI00374F3210